MLTTAHSLLLSGQTLCVYERVFKRRAITNKHHDSGNKARQETFLSNHTWAHSSPLILLQLKIGGAGGFRQRRTSIRIQKMTGGAPRRLVPPSFFNLRRQWGLSAALFRCQLRGCTCAEKIWAKVQSVSVWLEAFNVWLLVGKIGFKITNS